VQIGIIVDAIANTSSHYLLFEALNNLTARHSVFLFANNTHSLPMQNKFCILQQIHAMHHNGVLISTSLSTAQIAINCLTAKSKYYYIWYPE